MEQSDKLGSKPTDEELDIILKNAHGTFLLDMQAMVQKATEKNLRTIYNRGFTNAEAYYRVGPFSQKDVG